MIEEIKNGNQEIISQFYKKYREEFICWAKNRFSIDRDDAKDIFQECLLDFYLSIVDGKLTEINVNIKTYLFSCCKYKIYNLKKYKDRNVELDKIFGLEIESKVENEHFVDFETVNFAISTLPGKYQKIIELYYLQENCLEAVTMKLNFKNVNVTKKTKSICMKMLSTKVREIQFNFRKNDCVVG